MKDILILSVLISSFDCRDKEEEEFLFGVEKYVIEDTYKKRK